jgi:alpha-1,6-mannosyltransferase
MWDVALAAMMTLYTLAAPFTKVEESFNMQATYDLLTHPRNLIFFDHLSFPGIVPRTFIGPLTIATVVALPASLSNAHGLSLLLMVRLALGIASIACLVTVRRAVCARFSRTTGAFFAVVVLSQFHTLFYASRTLPNTFALCFSNLALAARIRPHSSSFDSGYLRAIVLLSFACALFRSELCILICMTILSELVTIPYKNNGCFDIRIATRGSKAARIVLVTIATGLAAAVSAAALSLCVDSYFWDRWSYPELEVFYFNVVLNKSHAWGTLPWHWYFTHALPKALGGAYPLAILGTYVQLRLLSPIVMPAAGFVAIYSILPHKELRFIFYALPMFNVAAAVGLEWLNRRVRSNIRPRMSISNISMTGCRIGFASICLGTSFALTGLSLVASMSNYPGGEAMVALHNFERNRAAQLRASGYTRQCTSPAEFTVHIDADAAMNGMTRFLERSSDHDAHCASWIYSRREDVDDLEWKQFTHLVTRRKEVDGFSVVHVQYTYDGLDIGLKKVGIRTAPRTYVHVRSNLCIECC